MAKNGYCTDVKVYGRLSYVSIKEKTKFGEKGTPKYSVTVIVSKEELETIKTINAAAKEAVVKTFSDNKDSWPAVFKKPGMFETYLSDDGKNGFFLRDGDLTNSPENKGCVFFKSGNINAQPRVFRRLPSGKVEKDVPLETIYSGCYATVMIDVGGFQGESKGVTTYLKGICFEKDGERLSGYVPPSDDAFGEVEEGSENPDNYGF